MFDLVQKVLEQVRKYGTPMSMCYYLLVFVFRAAIVFTFGKDVYGDEKKDFTCDNKYEGGCKEACFNAFTPIRHIQFWSFQILLICSSTVLFHLYATYQQSQMAKLKDAEEEQKKRDNDEDYNNPNSKLDKEILKIRNKKKAVGKFKAKIALNNNHETETLMMNRNIRIAFVLSLLTRLAVEVIFTFIGTYEMFTIKDGNPNTRSLWNFMSMRVPEKFICDGSTNEIVGLLCPKLDYTEHDKKLCFAPRANEKTVMLRFMNTISVICMLISFAELVHVGMKYFYGKKSRDEMEKNKEQESNNDDNLPLAQNMNLPAYNPWENKTGYKAHNDEMSELQMPRGSTSQMSHHSKDRSHHSKAPSQVSLPISHNSQATSRNSAGRHSKASGRQSKSKNLPRN